MAKRNGIVDLAKFVRKLVFKYIGTTAKISMLFKVVTMALVASEINNACLPSASSR